MRRLSQAGFKKDFVHPAVLPDWWDETCAQQPELLGDIEIRVARFLGVPISAVRNPGAALAPTEYANAQLRRVRDIDRSRLAPAIHSALRIGAAVVRSLRDRATSPQSIPPDPLQWRDHLRPAAGAVVLDTVLSDLWTRGIPVVPIDVLPAPSFQGVACIVEGRPVILMGHRYDEPGRAAFLIAHEAGHLAAGDCSPDQPVVDQTDEVLDDSLIERRADRYATRALVGGDEPPPVEATDFKELARQAAHLERQTAVDASLIIFAWAARTGDYAKASMAVRALYRGIGARRKLRQYVDQYVDLEAANETDRALLRCVWGEPGAR